MKTYGGGVDVLILCHMTVLVLELTIFRKIVIFDLGFMLN
jgi:hypothetical protein